MDKTSCTKQSLKTYLHEPWLVWLSGLRGGLQTKGVQTGFPVRAHAWLRARSAPSGGRERGNHALMFFSLSSFFPSPLSKNNKTF